MNWRRILSSRFVVVPAVIAIIVTLWNVYVAMHAHGLLEGRVVDAAGNPVAGATVTLFAHDFVTQVEKTRTKTDMSGRFRFTDNDSHLIQLQAQDGAAASPRTTIRLWFRAQDSVLPEPLRLLPPASSLQPKTGGAGAQPATPVGEPADFSAFVGVHPRYTIDLFPTVKRHAEGRDAARRPQYRRPVDSLRPHRVMSPGSGGVKPSCAIPRRARHIDIPAIGRYGRLESAVWSHVQQKLAGRSQSRRP